MADLAAAPDAPAMPPISILGARAAGGWRAGEPAALVIAFEVRADVVFDPDLSIEFSGEDAPRPSRSYRLREQRTDVSWLPRGTYEATLSVAAAALAAGAWRLTISAWMRSCSKEVFADRSVIRVSASGTPATEAMPAHWDLRSTGNTPPVDSLAWAQGHSSWFYKHFDHAPKVVISYMFTDSPLLRGRILDVGCGDGIIDLGIALRQQPELLVGVDPFRGYERLEKVLGDHALGHLRIPSSLRFEPVDANALPYPDDSFDVVISWGSLEHIAGGYLQALREIQRVLRRDGLFFVHPGLYYSNWGHHLGEFCTEPFFHLTKTHEELRELVLGTRPSYMDRAGEFSTPEQYWRWFNELNRIRVPDFEDELHALDFELWRVALRTEDLIEYTPELQNYRMQDLATGEVYLSCISRKKPPRTA